MNQQLKKGKWLFLCFICGILFLPPSWAPDDVPAVSMTGPPGFIFKGEDDVALTVNVSSATRHLAPLIRLFEKRNVPVSFFVTADWANKNEGTLQKLTKRAFDVGVLSDGDSLAKDVKTVEKRTGRPVFFVRLIEEEPSLAEQAASIERLPVQWSLDLSEGKAASLSRIARGEIVLVHPAADLRTTEKWLSLLLKKEQPVSLSEMFTGDVRITVIQ